jgi:hypothetical protein
MEYVTQKFENTQQGLRKKDAYSRQMTAQGYRIVSEQMEAGHIKGDQQCCYFVTCLPLVFLAGRTPGTIVVTYGRDSSAYPVCGEFLDDSRKSGIETEEPGKKMQIIGFVVILVSAFLLVGSCVSGENSILPLPMLGLPIGMIIYGIGRFQHNRAAR